MPKNTIEKSMKEKFSLFSKLSIGFGSALMVIVAFWFIILALELTDAVTLRSNAWLSYVYFVIFFFASLMVPAWIATSAASAINSLGVTRINTRKYKIEVLITSIVSILLLAIGALIIIMGYIPGTEDIKNTNWTLIGVGTILMLISLVAIIIGVVYNILGYIKSKRK